MEIKSFNLPHYFQSRRNSCSTCAFAPPSTFDVMFFFSSLPLGSTSTKFNWNENSKSNWNKLRQIFFWYNPLLFGLRLRFGCVWLCVAALCLCASDSDVFESGKEIGDVRGQRRIFMTCVLCVPFAIYRLPPLLNFGFGWFCVTEIDLFDLSPHVAPNR